MEYLGMNYRFWLVIHVRVHATFGAVFTSQNFGGMFRLWTVIAPSHQRISKVMGSFERKHNFLLIDACYVHQNWKLAVTEAWEHQSLNSEIGSFHWENVSGHYKHRYNNPLSHIWPPNLTWYQWNKPFWLIWAIEQHFVMTTSTSIVLGTRTLHWINSASFYGILDST